LQSKKYLYGASYKRSTGGGTIHTTNLYRLQISHVLNEDLLYFTEGAVDTNRNQN